MTFTRMQQFMIEDGFPPELILSDEQRKADWKGHHYTRQGSRLLPLTVGLWRELSAVNDRAHR